MWATLITPRTVLAVQQSVDDPGEQKLARFGIVLRLRSLAIDGPTDEVKKFGSDELRKLGRRCIHKEGWTEPEVVEELFVALEDVEAKREVRGMSRGEVELLTPIDNTHLLVSADNDPLRRRKQVVCRRS